MPEISVSKLVCWWEVRLSLCTSTHSFLINSQFSSTNEGQLPPSSHWGVYIYCTLAWKIPWMEEPGRLQSVGSRRVDTAERLHFPFSLSCIGEGNGNPLQCSCLENPRDGGAWWAAVYGVTQSWTRLKRLSSSSPFICFPFLLWFSILFTLEKTFHYFFKGRFSIAEFLFLFFFFFFQFLLSEKLFICHFF